MLKRNVSQPLLDTSSCFYISVHFSTGEASLIHSFVHSSSVSGKFITFEKVRETMRILFCALLRLCRNLMPEFNAHPVLSHLGTSAFTFGTSTFRPVFLHNFIFGSNSPMLNKKHATAKKLCNVKLVRKTIY